MHKNLKNFSVKVINITLCLLLFASLPACNRTEGKRHPAYPDVPVGTIITSMLPLNTFCEQAEEGKFKNPANWYAHESKWAPCDGRPVSGSKYAELLGKPKDCNAPDGRGVFIRGLNTFDPTYRIKPNNPFQLNPDTLTAGSLQLHAFQGHRHKIKIGDKSNPTAWGPVGGDNHAVNVSGDFIGMMAVDPITDGKNGEPRISSETRPNNISVYYYIRIN